MSEPRTAFFTVCSDWYFPGLVAMVNSLRILGHREPVVVGDCGLTTAQKRILEPHCELFSLEGAGVSSPIQYKPFPHLLGARGTLVFIDSDMVVTSSLAPIVSAAREGSLCIFPDPERARWFREWSEIFALQAPLRRQPYANTGFVAFSTDAWPDLLSRWWSCCERTFTTATYQQGAAWDGPIAQGDQDAFNALLMSEIVEADIDFQPMDGQVYAWSFPDVVIEDAESLRCRFRGSRPSILHSVFRPKPWEYKGVHTRNPYFKLMMRCLTGSDLVIRVPAQHLPVWLRSGLPGEGARAALTVQNAGLAVARGIRDRFSGRT